MGSAVVGHRADDVHAAAATGTLEVCKSAANGMAAHSFTFTVDATALPHAILGGTCSEPVILATGNHVVIEAQAAGFQVTKIASIPTAALVGHDNPTGRSTVTVSAGTESIVTYTNRIPPAELKVCNQAAADSTQLIGAPVSFTVNGGTAFTINAGAFGTPNCSSLTSYQAGTVVTVAELQPASGVSVSDLAVTTPPASNVTKNLPARTVTLTAGSGVNVVTLTNHVDVVAQPGFVEICKGVSDQFVTGNFSFSIMDAAGRDHGPYSILVGQCSLPIQVSSGTATISEAGRFPYYLGAVSAVPDGRLISDNLSNGTATVSVVAGDQSNETLVTFVNDTKLGLVTICKTLPINSGALVGDTFSFPFTTTAGISGTVAIVAAPPGQGACVLIPTPDNAGLPLGTSVSITENNQPDVRLTSVGVSPAPADAGSTATTANVTVVPGMATATFRNEALGSLEICKDAADNQTTGKPFTFGINYGSIMVVVVAGQCSPTILVPAGTARITEQANGHFHLVSATATGPDGSSRLLSGPNPAIVSVPFGGVGNETLTKFTNAVDTGLIQICKTTTASASGNGITLGGDSFTFNWTYSVDGALHPGTTSLTLPVRASPGVTVCTGLIGAPTGTNTAGIPVVRANGSPVIVNVSESVKVGAHVLAITYGGKGKVATTDVTAQTASFVLGQGVNILTYDNEPSAP